LRLNHIDVTLATASCDILLEVVTMPHLQTALGTLNIAFSRENLPKLVEKRAAFAEGKPLAAGIVVDASMALHAYWMKYIGDIPGGMQEAIRATIYQALSTEPPTQITFAWAPGYDYEMSMWQAPDTNTSKGGITILIKSRYPDDKHPIKG
jgi:mannosyltransferase OCH1-like enzyme